MTAGTPDTPPMRTVAWVGDAIEIIDQTKLPAACEILRLETVEAAIDAIQRLAVRGAPAIGVCGGLAMVLGLDEARPASTARAKAVLDEMVVRIGSARPTAVNLSWAVHRVRAAAVAEPTPAAIRERALGEALRILDEDREACRRIGELGARSSHSPRESSPTATRAGSRRSAPGQRSASSMRRPPRASPSRSSRARHGRSCRERD